MSFYQKNISALRLRNLALANLLSSSSSAKIDILPSFHPSQFLAQIHQLKQNQIKQIMLIGIGSGNALQHISTVLNPLNLIIIEPNPEKQEAVFHQQDLSSWIQNPNVFFVLGNGIHNIQQGLQSVKTSLAAHGYHQIVNPEVYSEFSPEVQFVSQSVHNIMQQETLFLRMRLARADMCQLNIIQNLPAMLKSISIDELKNKCHGIPALIIAAGPSLDQSIADIQQLKNNVLLIAVDTAVRTLLKNGIHPHIVVTTDPTRDNAKHFDDVDLPSNTLAAFSQDCHYDILRKLAAHPYKTVLMDNSTYLTYWLQSLIGFKSVMQRSLNVSEAAVRFALHLECSSIMFTGLDLAIPIDSGKTHTSKASHAFSIKGMKENQLLIQKHDGKEEWQSVVPIEGWDEEINYTYPSFKMYLQELEQIIRQYPVDWIDCTMWGAKKNGCQRMSLLEAVNNYGKPADDIQCALDRMKESKIYNTKKCIEEIKNDIEHISMFQKQLHESAVDYYNTDKCEILWNQFLQDKTVRALLDHAVFRFQLSEPVNRIHPSMRNEVVRQYAHEADVVLQQYIPLLQNAVDHLSTNA